MSTSRQKVKDLKLLGHALCLDFANTVDWRGSTHEERLHDYEDLLVWGRHAGALTEDQAQSLSRIARRNPSAAQDAYTRAIALREALYRTFSALSTGRSTNPDDLCRLNEVLSESHGRMGLVPRDGGFVLTWPEAQSELDLVAWVVARSAADLLTSDRLPRVHECVGQNCGWLFLDTSKNHSRRWCDMADCGNRAKARRNYARKRGLVKARAGGPR